MFGRILLIVLVATFLGWSLMTRTVDGAGPVHPYQQRNHLGGTTLTPGQRLLLP